MNYKATINYRGKTIKFQVAKIQLSGIYDLPNFLKAVRIANNDNLQTLHLKTDYPENDCEEMENGKQQITKDYLTIFAAIYKLPRKLAKIGIDPDEERKNELGDRLYQLRTEKQLTQIEMALMIGVARTTYASYETGQNEPDIKTLIAIANIFKVSLDYLVNRDYETK
ncbi:MAG: helix-turn-helix domain-containing protein [Acutalibacteraceae bacterium]